MGKRDDKSGGKGKRANEYVKAAPPPRQDNTTETEKKHPKK